MANRAVRYRAGRVKDARDEKTTTSGRTDKTTNTKTLPKCSSLPRLLVCLSACLLVCLSACARGARDERDERGACEVSEISEISEVREVREVREIREIRECHLKLPKFSKFSFVPSVSFGAVLWGGMTLRCGCLLLGEFLELAHAVAVLGCGYEVETLGCLLHGCACLLDKALYGAL